MLGISGGAIGAAAALDTLGISFAQGFNLTWNNERATFNLKDFVGWEIDIRRFAGKPVLKVIESPREITISLKDALFPGTNLKADFDCLLRRKAFDWRMQLFLSCGRCEFEGPFIPWLKGVFEAVTRIDEPETFSVVDDEISFELLRGAYQSLTPSWELIVYGKHAARVSASDIKMLSPRLAVSLLPQSAHSVLQNPAAKRTLIVVNRGGYSWDINLHRAITDDVKLTGSPDLFQRAYLEVSETARGIKRGALVFESLGDCAGLKYWPGKSYKSDDPEGFSLSLKNVRYARVVERTQDYAALLANFADEEKRIQVGNFGLQIGNPHNATPFEIIVEKGKITKFCCEPNITALKAPIPDGTVEYSHPPAGAHLAFSPIPRQRQSRNRGTISEVAGGVQMKFSLSEKRIIRTEDLFAINFKFTNLSLFLAPDQKARVVLTDPTDSKGAPKQGVITMVFPPQHIAEMSFDRALPATFPVESRAAGPSRLSFIVSTDDAAKGFDYTLTELLRVCRDGQLKIKTPNGMPPQSEPEADETAIEAPLRLILSPAGADAAWVHSLDPINQFGRQPAPPASLIRTELWHTRLGVRIAGSNVVEDVESSARPLRAVWARRPDDPDPPLNLPLQAHNRKDLVKLTFETDKASIKTERLMLSSLGAWMKVECSPPPDTSLEFWRHELSQGRDQYVKVVNKGYLYPWRHTVSHIAITERRFRVIGGEIVALLITKNYLVVREKTVVYDERSHSPFKGLNMLREVTILDDQPIFIFTTEIDVGPDKFAFWPDVEVSPKVRSHYLFNVKGIDRNGSPSFFKVGAIFIRSDKVEVNGDIGDIGDDAKTKIIAAYTDAASYTARYPDLRAQEVAFVDWRDNSNTTLETSRITFTSAHINPTDLPPKERRTPKFYPIIERVEGKLPALKHLRNLEPVLTCKYNQNYLEAGFSGANEGKVFMDVMNPEQLEFQGEADKIGTFVSLRMKVIALSALTGIVGGSVPTDPKTPNPSLDSFIKGSFNPELYFEAVSVFGAGDIKARAESVSLTSPGTPRLTYNRRADGTVESAFIWNTILDKKSAPNRRLIFEAKRIKKADPAARPDDLIHCELQNYPVTTKDSDLEIDRIIYSNNNGEPRQVDCVIREEKFDFTKNLALSFIKSVAKVLATAKLTAEAHVYSGTLILNFGARFPDTTIAIFKFHNLMAQITASLGHLGTTQGLEFRTDDPRMAPIRTSLGLLGARSGLEFRIADPTDPCTLSVDFLGQSIFHGKGYFLLRQSLLPMLCVPTIDGALEFGAGLSFGIHNIASLSVQVTAGIQYGLNAEKSIEMVGYLHCHGSMDVLGLIHVGVGFDAALQLEGLQLCCHVSLHVDIHLLFFSKSVDVPIDFCFPAVALDHAERKSQHSGGQGAHGFALSSPASGERLSSLDPDDDAFMKQDDWNRYCDAFA